MACETARKRGEGAVNPEVSEELGFGIVDDEIVENRRDEVETEEVEVGLDRLKILKIMFSDSPQ